MSAWWRSTALVAAVTFAIAGAQTPIGHDVLERAGIFAAPSTYTELAFTAPGSLPSQFPSTYAIVRVSFGIRNASSQARAYQWSIMMLRNNRVGRIIDGTVRVSGAAKATVNRTITTSCSTGKVRIVVSLREPSESIDYWTNCRSGRT
jgi:hypothetical protein